MPEQHFHTARGSSSVQGKGLDNNHPSTRAEDRETQADKCQSQTCHSLWFLLYRQCTDHQERQIGNWPPSGQDWRCRISLLKVPMLDVLQERKQKQIYNCKRKEDRSCAHIRDYRGIDNSSWLSASQVCRNVVVQSGEKLRVYTQAILCCTTLSPESHPQHILFHWINAAKTASQKKVICVQKMAGEWALRVVTLSCSARSIFALRLLGTEPVLPGTNKRTKEQV